MPHPGFYGIVGHKIFNFSSRAVISPNRLVRSGQGEKRLPQSAHSHEDFLLDYERVHSRGGRRLPARHLEFCRDRCSVADRGHVCRHWQRHDRLLRHQLSL